MFAQGQLLGMQTSLLNRLKTEIKAWDNVPRSQLRPAAARCMILFRWREGF